MIIELPATILSAMAQALSTRPEVIQRLTGFLEGKEVDLTDGVTIVIDAAHIDVATTPVTQASTAGDTQPTAQP